LILIFLYEFVCGLHVWTLIYYNGMKMYDANLTEVLPGRAVSYDLMCGVQIWSSFIHYGDLYSAPSRLLLRSAPDPCRAKEKI